MRVGSPVPLSLDRMIAIAGAWAAAEMAGEQSARGSAVGCDDLADFSGSGDLVVEGGRI